MTTRGTSTLRRMSAWDDRERAILIALLQERPRVASWPAVAVEIIEAGSARSVWDAYHEASPGFRLGWAVGAHRPDRRASTTCGGKADGSDTA